MNKKELNTPEFRAAFDSGNFEEMLRLAYAYTNDKVLDYIFETENPPVIEKHRDYVYADGSVARYNLVTKVRYLDHAHILTLKGNMQAIVASGWRAVEITEEPKQD